MPYIISRCPGHRSKFLKLSAHFSTISHLQISCSRQILSWKKTKTHYEVLGISQSASKAKIKEAYIALSKKLHPDKNKDDPDSHARFVRVNEAYKILSDKFCKVDGLFAKAI